MNCSIIRIFVFVSFGMSMCMPTTLLESVQAQEKINIFDKNNRNTIRRESPRKVVDEAEAQRIRALFHNQIAPESRPNSRNFLYYGIFVIFVMVIAFGIVGWQVWRQQQQVRALTDPMVLVNELNFVHQLSEPERRLMQELSEKNSLSSPLNLFVEPKFLLDALSNETFASSRPTAQQLLSKLFDIVKA